MQGMNTAQQRLFKRIPRGTNLETEIALVRQSTTELQQMLNEGALYMNIGSGDECRAVLIQDQINRNVAILNGLVKTQSDIHPERKLGGGLSITVNVQGQTSLHDVNEGLDADGPLEPPPGEQPVDAEKRDPLLDKFAELDDA